MPEGVSEHVRVQASLHTPGGRSRRLNGGYTVMAYTVMAYIVMVWRAQPKAERGLVRRGHARAVRGRTRRGLGAWHI